MSQTRRQQLEQLLADMPDDPFLRYGLAMEYVSEGQDETAVLKLRELIQASPEYVPGYMQAGQALVRLNRPAEAREIWARGVAAARGQGDQHAAEEMQGFIEGLD